MKLGLGLYRDSLTDENLRFARQLGVTHLVVHLVDYFKGTNPDLASGDATLGWGYTDRAGEPWAEEELRPIKEKIESHGLVWEAVENFDPAHWHDVLLDGPRKGEQLAGIQDMIRVLGKLGIPIMGYNFSIAGVWGWHKGPTGRGGAVSVGYDANRIDPDTLIPNGMVWNMIYDRHAPAGHLPPVSDEELWRRLADFLGAVVPVAEEAGVRLAAHPDDPPVETLRRAARLVNHPDKYQRLIDLAPSPANGLEFCMGTIQEMADGDLYASLARYAQQGRICYVHCRNVKGKVPDYLEAFIDEGDIDMPRALRVLKESGYDGMVIPDHSPEVCCAAPWHTGMAFALGYLRACLDAIGT